MVVLILRHHENMSKDFRLEVGILVVGNEVFYTVSQRIVLELLKELGGKAKTREVSSLAKIRYPESCLHEFVGHKLERLASWGYVYHDRTNSMWFIIDQGQNRIIQ